MLCLLTSLFLGTILTIASPAQTPFPLQRIGNGGFGQGKYVPTFHSGGEFPTLGNNSFHLESKNLRGGIAGFILLSASPANFNLMGMTIYLDPSGSFSLPGVANGKTGVAGAGTATTSLPIPNATALLGSNLYLQAFYLDSSSPLSLVHTQGIKLNIRKTVSPDITVLYDRLKYQNHFKGVNATQADTMGKAIWNANALHGFSYYKTQQFTCGGQSHWMVSVKDKVYGIEFMLIPGGSFHMGDVNNAAANAAYHLRETPTHWVRVDPFLMARTETTQGQWQTAMGTTPWVGQGNAWTGANAAAYPANWVNWNDAMAFCAKGGFQLPTEAQWEYACRAGTTTIFYYGNNPAEVGKYAWYRKNAWDANRHYPHQAGTKLPNAFGLHDMMGNVVEYCQDLWHEQYEGAPTNGDAWNNLTTSPAVTLHGGSYSYVLDGLRSAQRCPYSKTYKKHYRGFRVALPLR